MTNAEQWDGAADIGQMLPLLKRLFERPPRRGKKPPTVSHRKVQLFGVACCRSVWELLPDPRSRRVVEVGEEFADGLATAAELDEASEAAFTMRDDLAPGTREQAEAMLAAFAVIDFARGDFGPPRETDCVESSATEAVELVARHDPSWVAGHVSHLRTLLQDIFGNPFRPVAFDPSWRTSAAVALAFRMYDTRDFAPMPILADALQEAACDNETVLSHCRDPDAAHARGCWVVDGVLGKS